MLKFVQHTMKFCDNAPQTSEWISEFINLPCRRVGVDSLSGEDNITDQVDFLIRLLWINELMMLGALVLLDQKLSNFAKGG